MKKTKPSPLTREEALAAHFFFNLMKHSLHRSIKINGMSIPKFIEVTKTKSAVRSVLPIISSVDLTHYLEKDTIHLYSDATRINTHLKEMWEGMYGEVSDYRRFGAVAVPNPANFMLLGFRDDGTIYSKLYRFDISKPFQYFADALIDCKIANVTEVKALFHRGLYGRKDLITWYNHLPD